MRGFMLVRRFLSILTFWLAAQASAAADPFLEVIALKNLPEGKAFQEEVQWYAGNRERIVRLGFEDDPAAGTEIISRLKKLLEHASSYIVKDARNLDLLLFRILLYRDFYYINWSDYQDEIVAESLRIEALFPDDYRAYWLLGAFYASGVRPLESMKQFEFVVRSPEAETFAPSFWRSYASAAGLADMPKHVLEACRHYALLDPTYVPEEDLTFRLSNHFETPEFNAEIPPGRLYQFQERESGFGLLCRLFGIYLPVDRDWGTQSFGVSGSASRLIFTPESGRKLKNDEVEYSIRVEYNAHNLITFEEFIDAWLKKHKAYKNPETGLLKDGIGDYPFLVFEYSDLGLCASGGSRRGLAAFLARPEPAVKGLALERPVASVFNRKTGEPYYRPPRAFDRYDGEIFYVLAVDCCEEEFALAAETFKAFVEGIIFD